MGKGAGQCAGFAAGSAARSTVGWKQGSKLQEKGVYCV